MTFLPAGHDLGPPARSSLDDRASRLADTLASIEAMNLEDLRALWLRNFGSPPALRSPELMRLVLGWRLQARTYGGIDAEMRRKLKCRTTIAAQGIDLAAGTILTREWQGRTYEIEVLEEGFRWNGATYPSLSAVASAITGTRWNGPKFFGLRKSNP